MFRTNEEPRSDESFTPIYSSHILTNMNITTEELQQLDKRRVLENWLWRPLIVWFGVPAAVVFDFTAQHLLSYSYRWTLGWIGYTVASSSLLTISHLVSICASSTGLVWLWVITYDYCRGNTTAFTKLIISLISSNFPVWKRFPSS